MKPVIKTQIKNSLPATHFTILLERQCLEQGLRLTRARRIMLSILAKATEYLTVEDVYCRVLKEYSDTPVSVSTIYSNLRGLVDAGVIERRQFKSKQSYYSPMQSGPHDQLIDSKTGQVIEFHNAALDQLKKDIVKEYGFSMTECRVELYINPNERPSLD